MNIVPTECRNKSGTLGIARPVSTCISGGSRNDPRAFDYPGFSRPTGPKCEHDPRPSRPKPPLDATRHGPAVSGVGIAASILRCDL
jgi:hypothetical protein